MPGLGALVGLCLLSGCGFIALSGCGFIAAGRVSHSKPDGFLLRGYVHVRDGLPAPGNGCTSPVTLADVQPGATVRVSDPTGKTLANGALGPGVADSGYCNFPFEVPAVPGGPSTYVITVGARPSSRFPAKELREDKPAIINA
jgi:hypothetical protein